MTLKLLLVKLKACYGARIWVGDRDIHQAMTDIQNPWWIIWLLGRLSADDPVIWMRIRLAVIELVDPAYITEKGRENIIKTIEFVNGRVDQCVLEDTFRMDGSIESAVENVSRIDLPWIDVFTEGIMRAVENHLIVKQKATIADSQKMILDAVKRVTFEYVVNAVNHACNTNEKP